MLLAELTPAVAGAIVVLWLFVMGGAVGSFLNVVIYRLPTGKSIVWPGSHCPKCGHPIRWHDNVPVASWFFLGGRCRDCAANFSFRYPAVEAVTAALFVLVGLLEGLAGGANLPLEPVLGLNGTVIPPLDIGASAGIAAYHLLLLCTLLAAALIAYDGHGCPARLFVPAILIGWLAPAIWPDLHPVDAWYGVSGSVGELLAGAAGFGHGMLAGLILWVLPGARRNLGLLFGPACVGLFLGWQAAVVLAVVTLLGHALFSAVRRVWPGSWSFPPMGWLALGTLGWIAAWGWIVQCWPVLG
ncbi:MAG: prepilin peptidase [Planctomycetes bacterium]|nr:prepilin peptidase [Planctomycetota bacterium]